jgi:serine protease Do
MAPTIGSGGRLSYVVMSGRLESRLESRWSSRTAAGLVLMLAAAGCNADAELSEEPAPTVAAAPAPQAPRPAPANSPRRTPVVVAVERVAPAVVNIAAEAIVREPDPFFFFYRDRRAQSLGSGLIVEPNGVVVTNAHVIDGASRILVNTLDGRELEADVLGSDRDTDLAVLKVQARDLPAVPLGTSSDLLIGETVVAIGNPFGLSHTVTSGVLSARGRSVPSKRGERLFTDFLQIDASINPGNSGGPLVNLEGTVIGINTAIISGAEGIGFAIPADRVRRVVGDLLRFGELQPLWTGLRLRSVDPETARREGLPVERGALVERVYPDGPGAAAGIREGDILVSAQGQPVSHREDLTSALYSVPAEGAVALEVRRGDRTLRLSLTALRPPDGLGLRILNEVLGIEVEESRSRLVIRRVAAGSPAAEKGLRPGDLVLGANGQRVGALEGLGREVLRGLDRGNLLLVVQRGRYAYNLTLPL